MPRRRPAVVVAPLVVLVALIAGLAASPGPAAALSRAAWPTQSLGDRGTDVIAIQGLLRASLRPDSLTLRQTIAPMAALPPMDGVFGAATDDAVRRFQLEQGLTQTGIVDGPTWTRLAVRLKRSARGPAVVALQRELNEKRSAGLTVDGIFGIRTRAAVVAFQKHAGLAATGTVDGATWRNLVWHYESPRFGSSRLCDYSVGNGPANWGTAEAIASLEAAGAWTVARGYGRIAVGDVSLEHGGAIRGHETHRTGLDVDIRMLRKANDQCTKRTRWTFAAYDRAATRALVKRIRALAPGHIKLIYFNDPVLIAEGLTTRFAGHDDHLHIRFCEATHPLAMYDC
jgi:peptidoglycan hydrolase-like protein with peptidoglycan-binding domain